MAARENMTSGNDWLDEALRAHRPQPIANGGFTARVMSA